MIKFVKVPVWLLMAIYLYLQFLYLSSEQRYQKQLFLL